MVEGAFWLIGCYVAGMAFVHLCLFISQLLRIDRAGDSPHYVLYTCNNQFQVEWVIRSLLVYSWWRGIALRLTIVDEASQDDTLTIIYKLIGDRDGVVFRHRDVLVNISGQQWEHTRNVEHEQSVDNESVQVSERIEIRLNDRDALKKLPMLL